MQLQILPDRSYVSRKGLDTELVYHRFNGKHGARAMFSGYFDSALPYLIHDRLKVFSAFRPAFQIAGTSLCKTIFSWRLAIADFVILRVVLIGHGSPPSVQHAHQRAHRFPREWHGLLCAFASV